MVDIMSVIGRYIMHERPQLRILFLVFAASLIFFSPLLVILGPMFFPITFFYEKHTWFYYTPTINYYLFSIAVFLVIVACILLLVTNIKKWAIALSTLLVILSIVAVVGGAVSYMKMSSKGVTYQHIFQFEESYYKWSEIEKAEYYSLDAQASGRPHFVIYFKDGNKYTFSETSHVQIARASINTMLRANDVELIYLEKK